MIIFDFDGVLIDSTDEVIVTTFNLLSNSLVTTLQDVPRKYEKTFRMHRPLPRRAGELIILGRWCMSLMSGEDDGILTPSQYSELVINTTESIGELGERFYEKRAELFLKDRDAWLGLNQPYQPLWKFLAENPPTNFVILTYKNRKAVHDLCGHYGLTLDPENVYSGDGGKLKSENLAVIAARFGNESKAMVDDALDNLKELRASAEKLGLPFRCLLADWGYMGQGDREEALRSGVTVVGQDNIIEMMRRR